MPCLAGSGIDGNWITLGVLMGWDEGCGVAQEGLHLRGVPSFLQNWNMAFLKVFILFL